MPLRPRRFGSLLLVGALTAVTLAGCSSDEGSDGAAAERTTTTARPSGPTTTTTVAKTPSAEVLRKLLPDASVFGSDWALQTTAEDRVNPRLDAAMEQDCPAFNEIRRPDRTRDVVASYADGTKRELQVSFDRHPRTYSDARFAALVRRLDRCPDVSYANDDGTKITLTVSAKVETAIGDQAVRMSLSALIQSPAVGTPIRANTFIYVFRRGPVGVTVLGADAVDGSTGKVSSTDTLLVDRLATAEDGALQQLLFE